MKPIFIYGAGGFGKEISLLINEINEVEPTWQLLGYLDDGLSVGTEIKNGSVLGGIDFLNNYEKEIAVVFSIANPIILKKVVEKIANPKVYFPNIISPGVKFYESDSVKMGQGNVLINGCRLSCDVELGNFNLFNGFVAIGHDVKIGNYNIFSPSARLSGSVILKDQNFFGVNAIILQGVTIGSNTKVGVMSVIMKDTKDGYLYFGNPARKVLGQ
jgi:sugar O-acyltransferase (sialic acid O-acetyltransferase NeuD family)